MLTETKKNIDDEIFIYNNLKKTIEHTNLSLRKQKINALLSKKRTLLPISNNTKPLSINTESETSIVNNIYNAFLLSNEKLLETLLTQLQQLLIENKINSQIYQTKIQTSSSIPSDIFKLIPEIFFRYYNNELISYLALTSLTIMTCDNNEITQRLSDVNIIQRFLQIMTTNIFLNNIVHMQHMLKIFGNIIIDMYDTIELVKIYTETTLIKDVFRIISTIHYSSIQKEENYSTSIIYALEFINACIWIIHLYLDPSNKVDLPKDEVIYAMPSLCNDCVLNYFKYENSPYTNMKLLFTQLEKISNLDEEYAFAMIESGFLSTLPIIFEYLFDNGQCCNDFNNNKMLSTEIVHKVISIISNIMALPNEKISPYYISDISLIIEKLIMRYKIQMLNKESNIQETLLLLFGNLCCFTMKPEITTLISEEMVVSTLFKYYAKNKANLNELCFVIYNVFFVQSKDVVKMYMKWKCFDVLMEVFRDDENWGEAIKTVLKGFEGGERLGIVEDVMKEVWMRDFKGEAERLLVKCRSGEAGEVERKNEEMLNKFIEMYNKYSNIYYGGV